MNLAFPALLIILCVLPGIIFAAGFWAPIRRKIGFAIGDWSSQLAYGAIFALPIHWLWIQVARAMGFVPSVAALLTLLADKSSDQIAEALSAVSAHSGEVALYFFSISIFAFFAGKFAGSFTTATGLYRFLNTGSQWASVFAKERDSVTVVSAVVDNAGASYLYVGIVRDFQLDERGMLSGMWIVAPKRRLLVADNLTDPDAEIFYNIVSDIFFISTITARTISSKKFSRLRPEHEVQKRLIAHELWQGRTARNEDGTGALDWKRAELILAHREKWKRGWRGVASKVPAVRERNQKVQEQMSRA